MNKQRKTDKAKVGSNCRCESCVASEGNGRKVFIIVRLIASALFFASALLIPMRFTAQALLYSAAFLLCGYDVLLLAAKNILRLNLLNVTFLMVLAGVVAMAIGEYAEGVALMILFRIGELFEEYSLIGARRAIAHLMELKPDVVEKLKDGMFSPVPAEEALPGDILLIKPGDRVGLDGLVQSGTTTMDTSAITGEWLPRSVHPGDAVLSGFVNLSGAIRLEVTAPLSASTASRILELVESAGEKKARPDRFITRFARVYTPLVILAAVLSAFIPPVFFGAELSERVHRALVFLVISCPCALIISVPLSYFAAIGGATKKGILFKGSASVDALAKVKTIVFDKTGTLTSGSFRVVSIEPENISVRSLLMMAAYAERFSTHPLAKAVMEAFDGQIDDTLVSEHMDYPGMGVLIRVRGIDISCGNKALMDRLGIQTGDDSEDESVIHVAAGGKYAGRLLLSDTLKEDASGAVFQLQSLGIKRIVLLTGDREYAARKTAGALGIEEYRSECLPEDKALVLEKIIKEKQNKETVAYVGDGINEAPVLALADIGISMGTTGAVSAIEASDLVIMNDAVSKIPDAVCIARRTEAIVKQNILFALSAKLLILLLGLFGLSPLWLAVIAEIGVSIIATANAVRTRNTL